MAHSHLADAGFAELLRQTGIDLSALPSVMDSEQLAPVLGMTAAALAQDRYRGGGIPFVKLGRRVRYLRSDVADRPGAAAPLTQQFFAPAPKAF